MISHKLFQISPLLRRRFRIEMDNVPIVRVVESEERTPEHGALAFGAGDEVSEARRSRECGERKCVELWFDENGGGETVEREERRAGDGGESCEEEDEDGDDEKDCEWEEPFAFIIRV